MNKRYRSVLLFGPPASGKGLQGKILEKIPGIVHSAMGDIFRGLDRNSKIGKACIEYFVKGKLVPDDLTILVWTEKIIQMIEAERYNREKDILMLDGIPRTVEQVEKLEAYIDVMQIIHLHVPDKQILIDRISKRSLIEGRSDDANPEVIRHRLEVYENETYPVLSKYPAEKIVTIDAFLSPMEVLNQILSAIIPVFKK